MSRLSTITSLACALSEDAGVYLFQKGDFPNSAKPSVLSPEEARLILAQRLGVSQYHRISDASWIRDINRFGGLKDDEQRRVPELVLIVEGVTMQTALPLAKPFISLEAAFKISSPPSSSWTRTLVKDFQAQIGSSWDKCPLDEEINPFNTRCWNGKSKVIQVDLAAKVK